MICKHIESCSIFEHYFADKPQKTQEIMDKYCKKNFESCARYRLACVIGLEAVPIKLFPDMKNVADQLITTSDKKRKNISLKSQTLLNGLQPEDIFDFALDLLTESSESVVNSSYRGRDQGLRRFAVWFKSDLQNYYAKIIQIKIRFTGVRSRKRGKNPLTFFLENLRRQRNHNENSSPMPNAPEDICQNHFSSLKTRIALFKGLKTKPLPPAVVEAIEIILKVEEERLALGIDGLVKKFNSINS